MLNKRKVKVNKNAVIIGVILIFILLSTLFFSSFFEKVFLLTPNLNHIKSNALEVHFVDVGQGDATLVRLPNNETMLIDAGPKQAEGKLLDYINKFFFREKENTFNHVVLTHSDDDHAGNILSILNNYNVDNFYRPKIYSQKIESDILDNEPSLVSVNKDSYDDIVLKIKELESQDKTKVIFTSDELFLDFGNSANINFLSPHMSKYSNINDFSPIMIIESYNTKIMLTGDATELIERYVVNNYSESYLDVDVLKLGHHGSNTSTTLDFLEVVKPEFAVVSASKHNSYNHPHPTVINNIYEYSLNNNTVLEDNVLTTANLGNILFYQNENQPLEFANISHSENYFIIKWWVVVLVGCGAVVLTTYRYGVRINTGRATR